MLLKVIIKDYFHAKFQLHSVFLSKVSLGEGGVVFTPTPIHQTPIKKPILNWVNEYSGNAEFCCNEMGITDIDLNNINLDGTNYEEYDHETIITIKH